MKFKFKAKYQLKVGSYFYCEDGNESWHWHKIVKIDKFGDRLLIIWSCDKDTKVADPLGVSLSGWIQEAIKGEWRLADDSHLDKIPEVLKSYTC